MFRSTLAIMLAVLCGPLAAPARADLTTWLACHVVLPHGVAFDQVFVYDLETNWAMQFEEGLLYRMVSVSIDSSALHMVGSWSPQHGKSYNLYEIDRRNLSLAYDLQFPGGHSSGRGSCQIIPPEAVTPTQF